MSLVFIERSLLHFVEKPNRHFPGNNQHSTLTEHSTLNDQQSQNTQRSTLTHSVLELAFVWGFVTLFSPMRVVIQRVIQANVAINGAIKGAISRGLVVLLAVEEADTVEDIEWL